MQLEPPASLADDWLALPLQLEQINRKHQAILTNRTQTVNQQAFLTAFARANELFTEERDPLIPALPAQAELDWDRATHMRSLTELPQIGFKTDGSPALPAVATGMRLQAVDFLQQDDELIARLELKDLGGSRTGVRLNLFGYKHGSDFADLPKVQIMIASDIRLNVLVNRESIEDSGVTISNIDTRIILHVPLKLLGGTDIDHIFTTAAAYSGAKVVDDTAWHLLRLQPATKN